MPHNPRHGADPGVVIGGGSSPTPSAPQQPSNPQDYFGSMYTSPGSSTQVTNQPPSVGFNVGQVDPGLMSGVMQVQGKTKQEADRIAQQAMGNTGQGFGITGTGNFGAQDTSGSGTDTSGSGTGTDGSGQGTDSSGAGDDGEGLDDIILKVLTGPEIKRLTPSQMKRVQSILDSYIKLGETNPLKLRALMTGNIAGGIFDKDQSFSDMEGNIIDPGEDFENLIFQEGGIFFKDEDGELKPVRRTREGIINLLEEEIGSEGIESLKKFNPELYYPFMGTPQTSGGLLDLANIAVTPEMQGKNPELVKMIFEARAELDRMGKNTTTGTSNQGIMAASPALPGLPVRPPVTPPGTTPPAQPPIPAPVPSTGIMPQPFNIQRFYASLPQYTQQGIMSPNLAQYYQNLGLFPGMNV